MNIRRSVGDVYSALLGNQRLPGRLTSVAMLAATMLMTSFSAQATTAELAQTALEKLPGFEFAVGTNASIAYSDGVFIADIPGISSAVSLFQLTPEAGKPWHAQVVSGLPGQFDFRTISQRLSEKILGDISTTQVMLIVSSDDDASPMTGFPGPVRTALSQYKDTDGNLKLLKGVNIFLSMKVGQQGLLGIMNKTLNIGNQEIHVTGQLDKETINILLGRSDSNETNKTPAEQSRIALAVSIPSVTPVPFGFTNDKSTLHLIYPSTRLSILRTSQGVNEAYEISGSQQARIWVFNHEINMLNSIEVETKLDGSYTVGVDGEVDVSWDNALGQAGLNLDTLTMAASFDSGSSGTNQGGGDVGVKFGGKVTLPNHGQLSGLVDTKVENNKLTDVKFTLEGTEANGGIELGSLPVFNRIPVADRVRIERLVVGTTPQNKDVYLKGKTQFKQRDINADASILLKTLPSGKRAVILALKTDGLNLRKLVPSLPEKAEQLSLDGGVMTVSTENMKSLKPGSLPDAFKEMFSGFSLDGAGSAISSPTAFGADFSVDVPMGTGITVPIDLGSLSGEARQALERLGVTDPLVLAGSVGGVFDGEPSLSLFAKIPSVPIPEIGGKRLNVRPTDIGGSLFVAVEKKGSGTELQLGIDGTLGMVIGDDDLDFGGRVFLALSSMSQGVQLAGRMEGEWDDPFGMIGIDFSDVQLGGGINADSSIELNMMGTANFGESLNFEMAADVSAIVGTGIPVPKKVGLMFQGSELSMLTGVKVHNALLKAAAAGPLASAIPDGATKTLLQEFAKHDLISAVENTVPLPYVIYKDVAVYLSTPGASVPGFDGIEGLGGAMRGTLYFMNQNIGSTDSFLTLRNGLQIHATPGEFNMGPGISLNNADLDIRVPMPGLQSDETAHVNLKGEMSAGCDFMSGQLDVAFSRDEASFAANGVLAGYETSFDASVDLSQFPKFAAEGGFSPDLAKDIVAAIKERAQQKFQERKAQAENIRDQAGEKLSGAKKAVEDKLSQEAAKRRAAAQRKIAGIVSYLRNKENNAYPGFKRGWKAARVSAEQMKVEPNDSVSGVSQFKSKINAVKAAANKLGSRPKAVQRAKTAMRNAVNYLHNQINAITNEVANIRNAVEQLPAVQQARATVAAARDEFERAKQAVLSVTLDPIAARIQEAANILVIEDVGFDSGLDALCQKKLPQLNITGTFDGNSFHYPGLLQLAARADFVETNKARLDDLMDRLRQ